MTRLKIPQRAELPTHVQHFMSRLPSDPLLAMLSYSPATVELFVRQGLAQSTGLRLSDRFREVAILTVAGCCDCEYIAAQHEPMAATAGLSDTERAAIARKDFVGSDLTPVDLTVVEFVTAVIGAPRVSDRLFDQARGVLTDREIVEVLQICGYYWCLARVATILDLKPTTIYGQMPHLGDT